MGSFRDFCNKKTNPGIIEDEPPMIHKQNIRQVSEKRRPVRFAKADEDVITESENMIATLQEKIEQVFYRFGLAGLERVDGAIINCVNEMLHPDGISEKPARGTQRKATQSRNTVNERSAPQQKKPLTVREIAAAALRDLEPMDPNHEVAQTETVSENHVVHEPPPPPSYEMEDPMAALAGEQLNEEEKAMLQKALAEAGDEVAVAPAHRDMSALSLAAKALQS